MDENKYNYIVDICQLKQDFALLTRGDFTEIGDKGVNLSGGQKARIAIARALYSNADIYLFDDPLSALDAYVGMSIFNKVFKEYLKGKTVIVVTHALQYIPLMNQVYHMKEGKIEWAGTGEEATHKEFYTKFCTTHIANQKKEKTPSEPLTDLCDTEAKSKDVLEELNIQTKKDGIRKIKMGKDNEEDNKKPSENRLKVYNIKVLL